MNLNFNTFEIQEGKRGQPFRQISVQKGLGEKWVSGVLKFDWYYVFKYIENGNMFALHTDFNDKIIEKLNHQETLDKLCVN